MIARAGTRVAESEAPVDAPALRVLVVVAYPALRAGVGALLARDPGLNPIEAPVGLAIDWAEDPTMAGFAAIVVDPAGLPEGMADHLAEVYPTVPFVLLGADPATDGPGIGEQPVAYLSPEADTASLTAAVHGVAAGLTILDPAMVAASGLRTHAAIDRSASDTGSGALLTAREQQVMELVAAGLPNKTIAHELGISEHTAKFHVGSLLSKLGAASRTEAVTIATRRGLLTI